MSDESQLDKLLNEDLERDKNINERLGAALGIPVKYINYKSPHYCERCSCYHGIGLGPHE